MRARQPIMDSYPRRTSARAQGRDDVVGVRLTRVPMLGTALRGQEDVDRLQEVAAWLESYRVALAGLWPTYEQIAQDRGVTCIEARTWNAAVDTLFVGAWLVWDKLEEAGGDVAWPGGAAPTREEFFARLVLGPQGAGQQIKKFAVTPSLCAGANPVGMPEIDWTGEGATFHYVADPVTIGLIIAGIVIAIGAGVAASGWAWTRDEVARYDAARANADAYLECLRLNAAAVAAGQSPMQQCAAPPPTPPSDDTLPSWAAPIVTILGAGLAGILLIKVGQWAFSSPRRREAHA